MSAPATTSSSTHLEAQQPPEKTEKSSHTEHKVHTVVPDDEFDISRCFVTVRGTVPLLVVSGHGASLLLC